ncbi:ABC transporter, permease protein [Pediococcus damnosus]|uniref:ABC transporter, permease protein n=1 Tax=Pediococcus damnosus TaxID=51663 RepID=A0A0R2HEA2_9LACO|nr:ABC transporter permease [Pediococcus damnosus]AMV60384.1 ABC transporter, permease protein [Pediococcus damnosus]AMV63214.1 ABC transporter, permease protein [Pediococcus damnosus]AMV64634.1 ABC transporter, permease protein [Pediococcus damnosus]AMV66891.1 ABC transporter, permease protein [Pediococcus damnosus]AMV69504.1 ABC transporter, permease protein [Pediococcus damnosus]
MLTLINQELFKLLHKKSTYFATILLIVLMSLFAGLAKAHPNYFDPEGLFKSNFTGTEWVVFLMIAGCGAIVSMEFQYGTVKELLYRKYNRGQVIVSKWLTMFIYSVYLYALTFVMTIILKVVLFNDTFELTKTASNGRTLIENLGITMGGKFIGLWLILTLVLLLATLFKNATVAVSVGIIGYFASSIIANLMFILIAKWDWLKWNPINMLNLSSQVVESSYKTLTKLSVDQMVWGNLGYIVVFLFCGYLVFKKRNV